MRKLLIPLLAVGAVALSAIPAHAEPPVHDKVIAKDVVAVVPAPTDCPGPAAYVVIEFNLQISGTFTDETFHVTVRRTGTWTAFNAADEMIASGHFVNGFSEQGPGFPVYTTTSLLQSTGRSVSGELVRLNVVEHITVNANDEVTAVFSNVGCG
jgi:hypothetical protein